jgi:hypothetical protein
MKCARMAGALITCFSFLLCRFILVILSLLVFYWILQQYWLAYFCFTYGRVNAFIIFAIKHRQHNLLQLNQIFFADIFWWLVHSELSLFKMALKKETVFQSGLNKFSLHDDKGHLNQPLILVTPEWIRCHVVHYLNSGCQSNVGCSFVGNLVQVSVTMWIN